MARYELLPEEHGSQTIVVARLIGQADGETVSKLGASLAEQAALGRSPCASSR